MRIKKLMYFGISGAMCLAFSSCQNDADSNLNGNSNPKEKGELNYIAVNIVTANASSRADEVANASNYEDGTGNENAVNVVRLYFFDEAGNPFVVNVDDEENEYSYVNITSDFIDRGQNDPNVEKILTATAAVSIPANSFPSQVIAVINPVSSLDEYNLVSLSEVEGATDINTITEDLVTVNPASFVMSNSVYANDTKQKIETISISSSNFFTAAGAAQANPVTVYVERTISKVSLTTSLSPVDDVEETMYDTGNTYNEEPIYVKFLGWNVTSTTDKTYLMKNINPSWSPTLFGESSGQPWNYAAFSRSFWAVNPSDVDFNYYNFGFSPENDGFVNSDDPTAANAITGFTTPGTTGPSNFTYLQENAAQDFNTGAGTNHPSQVIVAAQLCDASGQPLTIAEWGFGQYTIEDLKKVFASSIATNLNPWKKVTTTTGTSYTQIKESDIEFVTAMSLDPSLNNWVSKGRYYVFAQLSSDDENIAWVNGNTDEATPLTPQQINTGLKNLGHAKIWNNGFTYYYFDIRHLGAENNPGYFGVVRNHVYKCDIKTLSGLGTPVYDPTETIYPEQPIEEETFIAAQINILSWRIVSQNVNFAW